MKSKIFLDEFIEYLYYLLFFLSFLKIKASVTRIRI